MDAVISIGGQSLIDGIIRLLGPALQPLRAPMPVALPGLTNGLLTIRNIEPQFPGANAGQIEPKVDFELSADVVVVANVSAANLSFPTNINLNAATGTVGAIGATTPLNLNPITGTLQFPTGAGVPLPLPAVVPVAVDLAQGALLSARVFLTPGVNGALPVPLAAAPAAFGTFGIDAATGAATGFGLDFGFTVSSVQAPSLPAGFATTLQSALTAVITQLLQGLGAITQPPVNVSNVANAIVAAIPSALQSTLSDAFRGLRARTGRLIYPAPPALASCAVRQLPTVSRGQVLVMPSDGSLLLQLGFDRIAIPMSDTFPPFAPTGTVDTGVTLTNAFLRDLLVCLVEKFPNLSVPPGPPGAFTTSVGLNDATWTPITLNVGPFAFSGTLVLAISGMPAGPGMPPMLKTITLTFTLTHPPGGPVAGPDLDIRMTAVVPIAFDLNSLASISALRLAAPGITVAPFTVGLTTALWAILILGSVLFATLSWAGPLPIFMPGLLVIAFWMIFGPILLIGMLGSFIRNAINQVLNATRLLESPAALPPGVFDAFGTLVQTSIVVDDVDAAGVLNTPTSPWAVLPITVKGPRTPPPDNPDAGPIPPPTTSTPAPPRTPRAGTSRD